MDLSNPGDKGYKSDRDRNRRDDDVKMRSLKVLGSDRRDRAPFASRTSFSRSLSGIDRDGHDRAEGAKSFWRKSYGSERESGDGVRESTERSDGGRTPSRKYERDGMDRTDSGRNYLPKGFGTERDILERSEGPRRNFAHERDCFDRNEVYRSSTRRGFTSDERTGLKTIRKERGESTKDWAAKSFMVSDRDGLEKGEPGKSPIDNVSALERDGRESPKVSPKRGLGSERDGRGETTKLSPRKGSALERDCTESLKVSPKKGPGAGRDALERLEAYRISPIPRERPYRETEKLSPGRGQSNREGERSAQKSSPGNGQEREHLYRGEEKPSPGKAHTMMNLDEVDKGSWYRDSSKAHAWGFDKLEDVEGEQHGGRQCEKEGMRKRSPENLTPPPVGLEDREGKGARFHAVKRLRSDRDQPRREDAAGHEVAKEVVHEAKCGGELEAIGGGKAALSEADSGEEEGATVPLKGVKAGGNNALDSIRTPSGEVDKSAKRDNKQVSAEESKTCEVSSGSREKSEMEEGELEPEDEAVGSLEGTKKLVGHAAFADGKTVDSHDKMEHIIDNQLEDGKKVEDVIKEEDDNRINFERKREVKDLSSQQIGDVASWDNTLEGGMPERLLEEQTTVPGTGISQEHGRTSGHEGDSQKEQVEAHEVCMRESGNSGEMKSDCKTYEALPADFNEKEKRYTGLTLDLLVDRMPSGDLKRENEGLPNLHVKVASVGKQRESDDSSKELTLSLSINLPATEHKDRDGVKEGRSKINAMEEQRREELQVVNNMKVRPSAKGRDSDSVEFAKPSCERQKQKRPKLEPLHLSLALPDTSSRLASSCPAQVPGSPEPDKTIQSFGQTRTNSDGFTNSLSFSHSHSHPFVHNPSCSLTRTSFDNQEFSCGSQQISQGNEQMSHGNFPFGNDQSSYGSYGFTGLPHDRMRPRREVPLYQRLIQNGNLQSHQSFPAHSGGNKGSSLNERAHEKVSSNQISQGSHQIPQRLNNAHKNIDARPGNRGEIEKHRLAPRDQDRLHHDVWLSPAQGIGSQETKAEHHTHSERGRLAPDRKRCAPASHMIYSAKDEDAAGAKSLGNEKIGLLEIVTEPVPVMAKKLQELPDSFLEGLKDVVKEMLGSIEKREEFISLQKTIMRRTDLTQETLLRAHRTQLELLLALKTGMQAFVHPDCRSLTYKALIEIFLQTRCRNFCCQASLPVDGCECRICSQKSGFCNACMCVVCSKFDFEAKTCRWVGCDYCMHWCHTDCGLRMCYIVPGPSIRGTTGISGMQFRCIACDHNSELFGFVKEVFTNFANDWNAETLAKELDCVRRIFHGSEDMRGKQLCWKAEEMLQKLENKVDVGDVCRSVLRFFTEGNAELQGACGSAVKPSNVQGASDHMVDALWDAMLKLNPGAANKLPDLDRARAVLQTYDREFEEKKTEAAELQYDRARKKAEIDELESVVRIKQAEAKMFQLRADEARQEAEGLQRIVVAKSEKIDEEYTCKLIKLQLNEAEERRRKRLEELHVLERAQHDYQSMKMRMEIDIKDLLKKMEAAKRQLL